VGYVTIAWPLGSQSGPFTQPSSVVLEINVLGKLCVEQSALECINLTHLLNLTSCERLALNMNYLVRVLTQTNLWP
jgi:hypothetical protein